MTKRARLAALVVGLAGLFVVLSRTTLTLPGARLSREQVKALAWEVRSKYYPGVRINMLAAIAEIESDRNPLAVRFEPMIGDASIGLMQVLLSTAQWLAMDMGARAFGVPSAADLLDPMKSMYFAAAYIHFLQHYRDETHSEEWIVRSYNGGPGNLSSATEEYYRRYLKVFDEVAFVRLEIGS